MSLSRKFEAGEILLEAHFFACQSRKILIHSLERCPTEAFFKLPLSRNQPLIFGAHDPCFPTGATVCPIVSWVQLSIFLKKISFPIPLLVLNRVDLWDLRRSRKDMGRLRMVVLDSLNPSKLKGTNVIILSMGRDEGLKNRVDESIFI